MMVLSRKICFNSEMMDLSSNVKTLTKLACKVVFFEKNSLPRQFGLRSEKNEKAGL
jgi:hypothetical protein